MRITKAYGECKGLKRAIGLVTNYPFILSKFDVKCNGDFVSMQCWREADVGEMRRQVYPESFCRAICKGVPQQKQHDVNEILHVGSIDAQDNKRKLPETKHSVMEFHSQADFDASNEAFNHVNGKHLVLSMVRQARLDELTYFQRHSIYTDVPIRHCFEQTGKSPSKMPLH